MQRRTLVISAVNFTDGGPLKILQDAVKSALSTLHGWDVVVLVNRPGLLSVDGVTEMCFPNIKGSWTSRIWFELVTCRYISREFPVDLWCAMHDMTPSVKAKRQVVYCHNPAPFYSRIRIRDIFYDPRFFIFYLLYKAVYRHQVLRNYAVVVQQSWLREELRRLTHHQRIIVSTPTLSGTADLSVLPLKSKPVGQPTVLFYPAVPRVFKNIECVCEAFSQLPDDIRHLMELRLTIDGSENRYARSIRSKYGHLIGVKFIGYQSNESMQQQYSEADLLVFPSRLETWGLPITEAKSFGLPILVSDLPYAMETVGSYDLVKFVKVDDPKAWRDAFIDFQRGITHYDRTVSRFLSKPAAGSWAECWNLLTQGL